MKHIYYVDVDKTNAREMFDFLNEHFTYPTLNSWNNLYSIANNVKVYNLQLEGDEWLALGIIENENYTEVDNMIYEWEADHKDYKVCFNGRSGGYLVMYNKDNNHNVIPYWVADCSDYEEFEKACDDYYCSVDRAIEDLKYYVELVQSFDMLCDEIRDYMNVLSLTSKDDMLEEEFKNFTYDFNGAYESDIQALKLKGIDLKKDDDGYYIDITNIKSSNSLNDCLYQMLSMYNNATSLYEIKGGETKIRIQYRG